MRSFLIINVSIKMCNNTMLNVCLVFHSKCILKQASLTCIACYEYLYVCHTLIVVPMSVNFSTNVYKYIL